MHTWTWRIRPERLNGLELSCLAEAGNSSLLYGTPTGETSSNQGPARRVSFSELLGAPPIANGRGQAVPGSWGHSLKSMRRGLI